MSVVGVGVDGGGGDGADSHPSWVDSNLEFPIRRIYCVGRNYRDHAIEMGGNPEREAPFFFQKPSDAIVVCYNDNNNNNNNVGGGGDNGTDKRTTIAIANIPTIPYPSMTSSLHYEGEFIVAIGKDGACISVENASSHIYGYAVGCDLTRRDLQNEAKKSGRPWDAAKGFDFSCPMSPIIPREELDVLELADEDDQLVLTLTVNNAIRQRSSIRNMIYSTSEIISNLSNLFRLQKGDIILTGTPAGVSNLSVGDVVSISCGDYLIPCEFAVGEPQ